MRIFLLILLLAVNAIACPQVITPVSGIVLRRVANSVYKPISGATVAISNESGTFTDITDSSGAYHIDLGGCFGRNVIHVTHKRYSFRPITFTTSNLTVEGIVIPVFSTAKAR